MWREPRPVLRVSLALALCASAARANAAPPTRMKEEPARAPAVEESAAERRAVRGSAVQGGNETPELREVRRFEEAAFPSAQDIPTIRDGASVLPPGLDGRWGGSGDIPPELRTHPTSRRPGRIAPQPESEWLRSLALPQLPVRWEPQVVRFLEFFKNDTRGRAIMAGWLRRQNRFRALFEQALDRNGLPRDLIYVSMIESGYEPGAVSSKAAGGLWQFMPGVARAYGLEVSHWVDARRDPERSVEAAARYFKDLYWRFGSWPLAFAAYHAGYSGILTSITRFNSNDYWELCRHEAGLPWETTLYVPKILAAAIVGHNRAAFGFGEVPPDPPFAYERVEVAPGTMLSTVAKAAGVAVETVQALNPELVRGRTPPDRGPIAVRIPVGTAAVYAAALDRARGAGENVDTVVVRFGESLEDVARTRGITVKELRRLNGIKDATEVRGGMTIVVPARATAPKIADDAAPNDEVLVAVPERAFSYGGRERVFYRTSEGDTLEELAGVFHISPDEIVEWNNLDPDAKLQARLVLQLYVDKSFDRTGVALLDPDNVRVVTIGSEEFLALEAARRGKTRLQYTARAGDTLAKIARRYGLQPGDLARINKLSSASELSDGQKVVVYSPTTELPREVAVGRTVQQHRRPLEPPKVSVKATATKAPSGKTTIKSPAAAAAKVAPRSGAKIAPKAAPAKAAPKKSAPTGAQR